MSLENISAPWKFLFSLALLIGVFAIVVYLFQMCWNMGLVAVLRLSSIEFETASYLVGLISLTGILFRGVGHSNNSNTNK